VRYTKREPDRKVTHVFELSEDEVRDALRGYINSRYVEGYGGEIERNSKIYISVDPYHNHKDSFVTVRVMCEPLPRATFGYGEDKS